MSLREMVFTPAEFAGLAKIDRTLIPTLEQSGVIKTIKRRVGNVERKMIPLESAQEYFKKLRRGEVTALVAAATPQSQSAQPLTQSTEGTGAVAAGEAIPVELVTSQTAVAVATGFIPQTPKHKIQMFYNVKGGTGKSTLTAQYVMRAATLGYRVLAVDLDGQGHLTVNLDLLDAHERPTVYDILINDLPIDQAIINIAPGLDLIPANLGLCNIEIPLNNKARREYRLSEALEKIQDRYDLIVADTNPAASILNGSMLVASGLVNVVCATNPLSFHGMSLVMATIENMEKEFRRELELKIIPNLYDNREVISQEVLGELHAQFQGVCTKAVINRSADLNEATKRRTAVWSVNSKGTAAHDIATLTEELLTT